MKLKYWIRYRLKFLRHRTPHFNGKVKHFIWGTGAKSSDGDVIPKIIWMYWNEEKITSITVQLCVNHIKNLHPDYEIHLLNTVNLLKYLPDFPVDLLKRPSNFVSDMARLMLLEQNGGVYLDATVLLSKKIDWSLLLQKEDRSEVVLYYTDENTREDNYPMVETWFIAALPKSEFIRDWRKEYQNHILNPNSETDIESSSGLKQFNFPLDPTYYVSYMAGQIVMRKNSQYRLSLLRAEDDAFSYGLGFKKKWNEIAMAEVLLLNEKTHPLPNLIKLIRFDRRRLDFYIQWKFYVKNSWLGELLTNQHLIR